jgi:hypothetical protein
MQKSAEIVWLSSSLLSPTVAAHTSTKASRRKRLRPKRNCLRPGGSRSKWSSWALRAGGQGLLYRLLPRPGLHAHPPPRRLDQRLCRYAGGQMKLPPKWLTATSKVVTFSKKSAEKSPAKCGAFSSHLFRRFLMFRGRHTLGHARAAGILRPACSGACASSGATASRATACSTSPSCSLRQLLPPQLQLLLRRPRLGRSPGLSQARKRRPML